MINLELEKDIIINNHKYLNIWVILVLLIGPIVYILVVFKYQPYYKYQAFVEGNYLLVNKSINDIENNTFIYNDIVYNYTIINKEDSQNTYLLSNHKFDNNETIIIKVLGDKKSLIKYIFNSFRKESDNI
jgi:hypothetical protein